MYEEMSNSMNKAQAHTPARVQWQPGQVSTKSKADPLSPAGYARAKPGVCAMAGHTGLP